MRELEKTVAKYLGEFADRFQTTLKSKFPTEYNIAKTLTVVVDDHKVILNIEDYIDYIESGRKAGGKQPPVEAMLKFISVRNIIPRGYGENKPPSIASLAFLIGRKIARDGILPKPYLTQTIEEVKFDMDAFSREFEKEIENLLK